MDVETGQTAQQQRRPDDNEKNGPEAGTEQHTWDEAFLVTFGADDAQNPLNWSKKVKWGITLAVSGTGFVRIMVSTVRAGPPSQAGAD